MSSHIGTTSYGMELVSCPHGAGRTSHILGILLEGGSSDLPLGVSLDRIAIAYALY